MSAPIATMNTDHNSSDSGSPQRHPSEASDKRSLHIPDQYHRLHSHNPHRQLRPKSKYGAPTLKQNQSETNRVKTPKVPDEVRAHIRRQCTMPSYAVMAKPQERTRDDKKDSASDTHREVKINLHLSYSITSEFVHIEIVVQLAALSRFAR